MTPRRATPAAGAAERTLAPSAILSVAAACARLSISRATFYRNPWLKGHLVPIVGARVGIREADVEMFIATRGAAA